MLEILNKKFTDLKDSDLKAVIEHFKKIRTDKTLKLRKLPATAELIYWTLFLSKSKFPFENLNDISQLTDKDKKLLLTSYSILAKNQDDLKGLNSWLPNTK